MGKIKIDKLVNKERRKFLKSLGILLGGATLSSRLFPWRQYDETFSYQSSSLSKFTSDTINFMTWNIAAWRKRSVNADEATGLFPFRSDTSNNFRQGMENILRINPDILLTQEDTMGCRENDYLDSVSQIVKEFGNAFYTKFFNYDFYFGLQHGGDYGQATYSKVSLHDKKMFTFFYYMPNDIATSFQHHLVGSKGVNTSSFFWKGRKIYLDNLHLSSGNEDKERKQQLDLYFENIFDPSTTRIITGDFNFPFSKDELKEYEDGTDHSKDEAPYSLANKIQEIGSDKFVLPHELDIKSGMFSHKPGYETFPATNPDTLENTVCNRMYDTILLYDPNNTLSFDNYYVHQRVPSDHAAVTAKLRLA